MAEVRFKQTKVGNKWAMGKYNANVCINQNCFREREREREKKKNNKNLIYIVDNPLVPFSQEKLTQYHYIYIYIYTVSAVTHNALTNTKVA